MTNDEVGNGDQRKRRLAPAVFVVPRSQPLFVIRHWEFVIASPRTLSVARLDRDAFRPGLLALGQNHRQDAAAHIGRDPLAIDLVGKRK